MAEFKGVINEDDLSDEVYIADEVTVNDLKEFLEKLCKAGKGNSKISYGGATYFYIHLFDENSEYVTFDDCLEI